MLRRIARVQCTAPGCGSGATGSRALLVMLALLGGCYTGLALPDADGDGGNAEHGESHADGDGASTGEPDAPVCEATPPAPFMRRLTVREYVATVRDLVDAPADIADDFPADTFIDGFDNHVVSLGISTVHADRLMSAAGTMARSVVDDPMRRALVIGCELDGPDRAQCLTDFVTQFGRRAYRRALTSEEVDGLLALAQVAEADADRYEVASVVIQAMLQSPHFLYRVEIGELDPERPGVRRLSPYEIATRLSYLLWGTMPSDALLDRAALGELADADDVEAAAREMLADARARAGIGAFATQWVRLPMLEYVQRSTEVYPQWSDMLKASMAEETRRLLDDFLWTPEAALLDVLVATHTHVDAALAGLYELPAPASGWERMELDDDSRRGGLLTQASILTLAASSETTAPILRGKLVRDVLMCSPVPPPPPDVPEVPAPVPGESVRERLDRHRTDPECNGCHVMLDPIGFGLERYDLVGAYRDVDDQGNPLTGEGELAGFEPAAFVGPFELAAALRESPQVSSCLTVQFLRFASGRTETTDDACALEQLREGLEGASGNLPEAIVAFVRSDAFLTMGEIE
jgi:hypothetical protein